ncbi:MAG: glycosyltransferase, partial [Gammaproteobacteria bacterium]|nr:glycosyltransferase [Gammaproteobacteria bacterium]
IISNERESYRILAKNEHHNYLTYRHSASYKLGYLLINDTRSIIDFLKLPFNILKIWKEKQRDLEEELQCVQKGQPTLKKKIKKNISLQDKKIKDIRSIKVALLCDEFSYNSFKYEFDAITFTPDNWENTFIENKPDLFFCESAWSGTDSNIRPWKGKVYSSINFSKENRIELLNILSYCKQNNIPTIFWNKEDPTHYNDQIHNFIDTAIKFDYIFTTAEECVEQYKTEYSHPNVYCLPFAAQLKLFNPIEKYERDNAIIFAGSWYAQHKERCIDMEKIFDTILLSNKTLIIYDRHYGSEDNNHQFPTKYQKYIKPSIPHEQIDKAYKSSLFGLNINTVQTSSTMFARRVFELISSNTLVISNNSVGMEKFFGDNIIYPNELSSKLKNLTESKISQIREDNLHLVLENHTYYNRFKEILNTINFPYKDIDSSITIVMIADNDNDIIQIIKHYNIHEQLTKKLLIVLSDTVADIDVAPYYEKYNNNDTGVVSLSYLKKYSDNWESIINTTFIAILSYKFLAKKTRIKNALLHTHYIDNIMILDHSKKYTFSTSINLNNIICKKQYFKKMLMDYKKTINGNFYHV